MIQTHDLEQRCQMDALPPNYIALVNPATKGPQIVNLSGDRIIGVLKMENY